MSPLELVGIVVLIVVALALPAIGEGVRRRSEDAPDAKVDADVLARLDADVSDADRDR
jgi:hypothetical protein